MRSAILSALGVVILTLGAAPLPAGCRSKVDCLRTAAQQAVADDEIARSLAIAELRAAGPQGLDMLFDVHQAAISAELARIPSGVEQPVDPTWQRVRQALDAVGQQRDCAASHLYWYTDLGEATAAARQLGKPILSLRLLGRLTDEYSCANSRFFRSTLYSNETVSHYLRSHFVLHWQSERPVPVVTIDFGDGRKLQRTVTGNSVHYVLDADGHPVDALPGLYGPDAFLRASPRRSRLPAVCRRTTLTGLRHWLPGIANNSTSSASGGLPICLPSARRAASSRWSSRDTPRPHCQASRPCRVAQPGRGLPVANQGALPQSAAAPVPPPGTSAVGIPVAKVAAAPRAVKASVAALPKHAAEAPVLAAALNVSLDSLVSTTGEAEWAAIAQLHAGDARLDQASVRLIVREHPTAAEAEPRTITKRVVETPLVRMLRNFQQAIALDTVRNEYLLHRQIHEWFATNSPADLEALNARVYAELFLTPASDPWLGLVPPDTYTALENCGISEPRSTVE